MRKNANQKQLCESLALSYFVLFRLFENRVILAKSNLEHALFETTLSWAHLDLKNAFKPKELERFRILGWNTFSEFRHDYKRSFKGPKKGTKWAMHRKFIKLMNQKIK